MSVGKHSGVTHPSVTISEFILERNHIDARNVECHLVKVQLLFSTEGFILVRNPLNVTHVGKPLGKVLHVLHISEFIPERNPMNVTHVGNFSTIGHPLPIITKFMWMRTPKK